MKNTTLFYVIGLFLAIILAMWVYGSIRINKLEKQGQLQAVELMQYKDSTKIFKTKHGEVYAQFQVVSVEKRNLKDALEIMDVDRRGLREKGIKLGDLVSYYKAQLESAGNGSTPGRDTIYVAGKDTIWGKKFNDWTNQYLSLTNIHTDQKNLFFDHHYRTDIQYSETKTRKGSVVTIWLGDPKAVVTTGSQINVVVKQKWFQKPWIWGVGGLMGGYYLSKKL